MSTSAHMQSPFMNLERGQRASRSVAWLVLALLVGAVFIYAGAAKISDPVKFARDIVNFRIIPWSIAIRLAFYLPWLEIVCGIALFVPFLRRGARAILTALILVFIVATVAARARGINLDCGCFGSASKGMSFTTHVVIDFAILAGLLALFILPSERSRS